jgi:hypothetical protein
MSLGQPKHHGATMLRLTGRHKGGELRIGEAVALELPEESDEGRCGERHRLRTPPECQEPSARESQRRDRGHKKSVGERATAAKASHTRCGGVYGQACANVKPVRPCLRDRVCYNAQSARTISVNPSQEGGPDGPRQYGGGREEARSA